MTRASDSRHLRETWRRTQKMARLADMVCPHWWNHRHHIDVLTFGRTPAEVCFWQQLIKQRRGE